MRKKLVRVGVLAAGLLALAIGNLAVANSGIKEEGGNSNADNDLVCPAGATNHSQCTDTETGPVVTATGPITITSPSTATVQLTCMPATPAGPPGPQGDCRGKIEIFMGGVMDSKNYVHLAPNVPTTINLRLTKAGKKQAAAAFANGPGETKGTCPVKAIDMKDNDNGPRSTTSTAPDLVVG